MTRSPSKLWWGLAALRQIVLRYDPVSRSAIRPAPIVVAGRGHAAWKVPAAVLRPGMIVYAAGVGLDTTFDEEMVERHRNEGSSLGRAKLDVAREMSLRHGAAYVFALAWPSKAHLNDRSLRRRDAVASLVSVLRPFSR